ncbi:MAG: hypothetical protein HKN41_06425 [Ilumatobacter sp.]|nr:hypothetical protein [Ilumatobacter sp.]
MTQRLFVALWPDEPTVERLVELRDKLPEPDGVRFVRPEHWHVTLRFLGEVETHHAIACLAGTRFPAVEVRLGPRTTRLGAGQVVVPATGAERLAAEVRAATSGLGLDDDRDFFGHLTLARTKSGDGDALLDLHVVAAFTARAISLVASELRPTGAVYTTVETFPTHCG